MRERRSVPRYKFHDSGRLVSSTGEALCEIAFTTLSVRGCRVNGAGIPAIGETCRMVFEWQGKQLEDWVEVKWKKPGGDAGLLFMSLTESNLQLIRNICAGLILEPLNPEPPEKAEEEEP